jgi:hypothetical protein
MRRLAIVAACTPALAAVVACITFGYLACFISGARGDHYFNAAILSLFLAVPLVVAAAGAVAFLGGES